MEKPPYIVTMPEITKSSLRASLDLRNITTVGVIKGCDIPWSAAIKFTVNDLGIFEVRSEWDNAPADENLAEDDKEFFTHTIVVIQSSVMADIPNNISLDRVVGDFSFNGRDYVVCAASIDVEFTRVAVVRPVWRSGGFAYVTKAWMPPEEHFISSHATVLYEEGESISTLRFAVYMTFTSNEPTVEALISVEPCASDPTIYDVEIREIGAESSVAHFTVNMLRDILSKEMYDLSIEECKE